jgi:hypothetical protein
LIENQGSRTYFEQYCGHLPPDPDSENFQTTGFANELADILGAVQQAAIFLLLQSPAAIRCAGRILMKPTAGNPVKALAIRQLE